MYCCELKKRKNMSNFNNKINFDTETMPLNEKCNRNACNCQRKQIFKSKSVLKKRKNAWMLYVEKHHRWCISLVFLILPYLCECQYYPTRDPRWYSREGDYNYQWPNPGDTDYR